MSWTFSNYLVSQVLVLNYFKMDILEIAQVGALSSFSNLFFFVARSFLFHRLKKSPWFVPNAEVDPITSLSRIYHVIENKKRYLCHVWETWQLMFMCWHVQPGWISIYLIRFVRLGLSLKGPYLIRWNYCHWRWFSQNNCCQPFSINLPSISSSLINLPHLSLAFPWRLRLNIHDKWLP